MKKVSILLLCLVLALSLLTACGRNNKKDDKDEPGNNTTQNGSVSNNNMQNDMNGNTQTPADDVADGVGDVADGIARGVDDLWDGMLDLFGADRAPRTMEGDEAAFKEYGLDESLIEDYTLQVPENGDTAHEFFIAKVRDGKMAEVEKILEQRKEAIAAKWSTASADGFDYAKEPVIYKSGNYIMLAVYDDVTEIRPEFERLIGEMEEK